MALRNPVVDVNGRLSEMPSGDYIKPVTLGAGTPSANTILDGSGNWVTVSSLNYWTLSGSDVYRATGNVYIGQTSSYGSYRLQVTGATYFLGDATFKSSSFYIRDEDDNLLLYVGEGSTYVRSQIYNLPLDGTETLLKTVNGIITRASVTDITNLLGDGNYIQNQFTGAQVANAWITGDMRVNGLFVGGFGARTTGGTTNWNHVSNSTSGQGETLLLATHTNGFAGGNNYFHPFNFEYASRNGTGNITQLAIPYGFSGSMDEGLWVRGKYEGAWNNWQRVLTQRVNGNWIIPTGNVGIGTNPISSKFYVYQSSTLGQFIVGYAGNSVTYLDQDTIYFRSGSGLFERATFADNYTAIRSPIYIYEKGAINGYLHLNPGSSSTSGYIAFYKSTGVRLGYIGFHNTHLAYTSENGADHVFLGNNILVNTVDSIGTWRVQINSGSATDNGLYVNGHIKATGNIIADGYFSGTSSDIRYKSDFKKVRVIDVIDKINIVSYKHKLYNDARLIGSVAQEIEEYFPELITKDEKGYLRVDNYGYSALSLQLGKELKSEVDILKERVKELEKQVELLSR